MAVSDWSTTAAANTSIGGISLAEGVMRVPAFNNAIRELMAQAKAGFSLSGANTDITSIYLDNTGLKIKDTNASHGLSIVPGSNLTADRILTLVTGDAARTLTLTGNATLDQDVSTAGSPTLAGATISTPSLSRLTLVASSGGTDSKNWWMYATDTSFVLRTVNDAASDVFNFLVATRSGLTVSALALSAGVTTFNSGAETARVTSSSFMVGVTSAFSFLAGSTVGAYIQKDGNWGARADSQVSMQLARLGTDGTVANFYKVNTQVGSISLTAAATAYNTSSDERLKKFIGNYDPQRAIEIIRKDPVRDFHWVPERGGGYAIGWGAQTSYEVSPDLATKPDTEEEWWGVDKGKRTPYLWAAMSNVLDRLEALEKA